MQIRSWGVITFRNLRVDVLAFNSDSRPPQVVPRTPKDVSAADADDVPMHLPNLEASLNTNLATAVDGLSSGTEGWRYQRGRIWCFVEPNVGAKRATTAGRQRPGGEIVPRTTDRALVACRWRSA